MRWVRLHWDSVVHVALQHFVLPAPWLWSCCWHTRQSRGIYFGHNRQLQRFHAKSGCNVRGCEAPVVWEEAFPIALSAGFLGHACNQFVHLLRMKRHHELPVFQALRHVFGLSDSQDGRVICGNLRWEASTKASTCN